MPKYLFYRSESCDDVWVPLGHAIEDATDAAINLIRSEVSVMFDGEHEHANIELMFKEMTEEEYAAIPEM